MNCQEISPRLTDYLVSELDAAGVQEVDTHLAECAVCKAEMNEIRGTIEMVKESEWPHSSALAPTSARDEDPHTAPAVILRPVFTTRRYVMAAAIAATLIGGATVMVMRQKTSEDAMVAPAVVGHEGSESIARPEVVPENRGPYDQESAPQKKLDSTDKPEASRDRRQQLDSVGQDKSYAFEEAPKRQAAKQPTSAPASEVVTVTAGAPLVDLSSTPTGANVTQELFDKIPTDRNFRSVSRVAPGANESQRAKDDRQASGSKKEGDVGGTTVHGSAGAENAYIVDGIETAKVDSLPPPGQPHKNWASAPPTAAERERSAVEPAPKELTKPKTAAEREKKLRSLGYLSDAPPAEVSPAAEPPAMYFEDTGVNPFVETAKDPLSTFGLDVDTASFTVARNYLQRGLMPPIEAIRAEEFVNYLPSDLAPPKTNDFAIRVDGAPNPFRPTRQILRVALRAREIPEHERKPASLVFVIDVSGSMNMENRLGLVKRSLRLLVDRLDERDSIGIVVYGSSGGVVLQPTSVAARQRILAAIDSLQPGGSTNLEEGLELGFQMAASAYDPRSSNRVILCTDGVANNGVTDAAALLRRIEMWAGRTIYMTALGFGMGNYNDALLQKLADFGDGQYAYIDDFSEAENFFLKDLTGVLEVIARDAKIQVEFDPRRVSRYRLIGYEKRDIADRDFRNDAVDAGEIPPGHAVTALYELELARGGAHGDLGDVRLRYEDPDTGRITEVAEPIRIPSDEFEDAAPGLRLAFLAARFAEHLRASPHVRGERLGSILERIDAEPRRSRNSTSATELRDMVQRAVAIER